MKTMINNFLMKIYMMVAETTPEQDITKVVNDSGGSFTNILKAVATQLQVIINVLFGIAIVVLLILKFTSVIDTKKSLMIGVGGAIAIIIANVVIQVFLK